MRSVVEAYACLIHFRFLNYCTQLVAHSYSVGWHHCVAAAWAYCKALRAINTRGMGGTVVVLHGSGNT